MHHIKPHLPLPEYLTVSRSSLHGLGIIANKPIKAGTDLGVSHVIDDEFEDGLIRTPLGGFLNHSDNPNSKYLEEGKNLRLVTNRDINQGEEVTVSYRGSGCFSYNKSLKSSFPIGPIPLTPVEVASSYIVFTRGSEKTAWPTMPRRIRGSLMSYTTVKAPIYAEG